jgi:hypothetical protein
MTSYVTNVNTTAGGASYVDIGTLFCDNSYNQTLAGNKTFSGTVYVPTPATDASRTEVINAAWMYAKNYAPINNPVFTGTPNAPTPATDASRTEMVNAKWVRTNTVTQSFVRSYGFIAPLFYTVMDYLGVETAVPDTGAIGSPAHAFDYGIYMCCMRNYSNRQMTVSFIRISSGSSGVIIAGANSDNNGMNFKASGTTISVYNSTSEDVLQVFFYKLC